MATLSKSHFSQVSLRGYPKSMLNSSLNIFWYSHSLTLGEPHVCISPSTSGTFLQYSRSQVNTSAFYYFAGSSDFLGSEMTRCVLGLELLIAH